MFLRNVKSWTIPIRIMSAVYHTFLLLEIIIFLPVSRQWSLNTSIDGRMLDSDFDMWWSLQKCMKLVRFSPLVWRFCYSVVWSCVTIRRFSTFRRKRINLIPKDWNIQVESGSRCVTSEWGQCHGREICCAFFTAWKPTSEQCLKSCKLVYRYQRSGRAVCGTSSLV